MAREPVRVLVTGASGQIGYALVPMIARGVMPGPDQPVILHMLDIPPASEALNGVKMELIDAAFPLLKDVLATTDAVETCTGVSVAVMVGAWKGKMKCQRTYPSTSLKLLPLSNTLPKTARLNGEFIATVQQRGAAIFKARKLSSALSAASVACDYIRDWVLRSQNSPGPAIDELSRQKMDATGAELVEEKTLAYSCLS